MFELECVSPGMTGSVTVADPTSLSGEQLRAGLTGFERGVGFMQAGQFAYMAEMARREEASWVADPAGAPSFAQDPYGWLADEVAVELGLSKLAAS
ncbi:MAG TPA: hypothetical protein VMT88_06000, partial [Actinomycetes bacterium]|nr:hypothetical protein [Actinomycetes bacterium]